MALPENVPFVVEEIVMSMPVGQNGFGIELTVQGGGTLLLAWPWNLAREMLLHVSTLLADAEREGRLTEEGEGLPIEEVRVRMVDGTLRTEFRLAGGAVIPVSLGAGEARVIAAALIEGANEDPDPTLLH